MSQPKETKGGRRLSGLPGPSGPSMPEQPKKRGPLRWILLAIILLAMITATAFAAWSIFSAPPEVEVPDPPPRVTEIIDDYGNVTEVPVEAPRTHSGQKKEFYTFLLIGQDTLGGGNTDTMMLAAYNVPNQELNVMSLPRDTFVNYGGNRVLLNSVYVRAGRGEKGMAALKAEISELTGVYPNYHVVVQWDAVGELVDAIDGVDFEVPRRMYYNDLSQGFKIDLEEGFQHLNGAKAMQLIRWRHNSDDRGNILNSGYANGDLGRIQTQQDFLKAVIKKCLQPNVLLPNLAEYVKIFQDNVETNLTASNLAYFGKSAVSGLNMENVEFMTMPYKAANDGAHVLPDANEIVKLVNEKFNPYEEDLKRNELDLVTEGSVPASSSKTTKNPGTTKKPATTKQPVATTKPSATAKPAATKKPAATAKPTASPVRTASPTSKPTPKPTSKPTAKPTATPKNNNLNVEPTDYRENPDDTPTRTETPVEPSDVPATRKPVETETPVETKAPDPVETQTPARTQAPAPVETQTPARTQAPAPVETPKPPQPDPTIHVPEPTPEPAVPAPADDEPQLPPEAL